MVIKILEILNIIILLFVVLGVHELGKLMAGFFQGFRLEHFVVGHLGSNREDTKLNIFYNISFDPYATSKKGKITWRVDNKFS